MDQTSSTLLIIFFFFRSGGDDDGDDGINMGGLGNMPLNAGFANPNMKDIRSPAHGILGVAQSPSGDAVHKLARELALNQPPATPASNKNKRTLSKLNMNSQNDVDNNVSPPQDSANKSVKCSEGSPVKCPTPVHGSYVSPVKSDAGDNGLLPPKTQTATATPKRFPFNVATDFNAATVNTGARRQGRGSETGRKVAHAMEASGASLLTAIGAMNKLNKDQICCMVDQYGPAKATELIKAIEYCTSLMTNFATRGDSDTKSVPPVAEDAVTPPPNRKSIPSAFAVEEDAAASLRAASSSSATRPVQHGAGSGNETQRAGGSNVPVIMSPKTCSDMCATYAGGLCERLTAELQRLQELLSAPQTAPQTVATPRKAKTMDVLSQPVSSPRFNYQLVHDEAINRARAQVHGDRPPAPTAYADDYCLPMFDKGEGKVAVTSLKAYQAELQRAYGQITGTEEEKKKKMVEAFRGRIEDFIAFYGDVYRCDIEKLVKRGANKQHITRLTTNRSLAYI